MLSARLVAEGDAAQPRADERLMEMNDSCFRYTLREDLLIDSMGISEPMPVTERFTFRDDEGHSLSDIARLDTPVTVVGGFNLLCGYASRDTAVLPGAPPCFPQHRVAGCSSRSTRMTDWHTSQEVA